MNRRRLRMLLCTAALVASGSVVQRGTAAATPDVATLVVRVGERVAAYYQRAQRLVCLERSTVIPIGTDLGGEGFARTVESELRLEIGGTAGEAGPSVRITRQTLRINGRAPRDRDRKDRSGCTDPVPLGPELLTFMLPGQRDEYRFTAVRPGRERERAALIIDFASAQRISRPELIEDEFGHDDCFDWKGPVGVAGRLWVDAETHDVLRLDRHLNGPTDVRVPDRLQRKYRFSPSLTIDRDDLRMRYREVAFSNPDETMLVPESIESLTVLRSGLQSTRRTQIFSGYQRFLTASRVK